MIDAALHLGLVHTIARKYERADEADELVSAGTVGLVQAAETYREDLGAFSTHAGPRIRGAILDHLRSWYGRRFSPEFVALPPNLPSGEDFEAEVLDRVDAERRLARLSPAQRLIAERYYLRGEYLEEIGASLGVSGSRVCQIKGDALAAMRGPCPNDAFSA